MHDSDVQQHGPCTVHAALKVSHTGSSQKRPPLQSCRLGGGSTENWPVAVQSQQGNPPELTTPFQQGSSIMPADLSRSSIQCKACLCMPRRRGLGGGQPACLCLAAHRASVPCHKQLLSSCDTLSALKHSAWLNPQMYACADCCHGEGHHRRKRRRLPRLQPANRSDCVCHPVQQVMYILMYCWGSQGQMGPGRGCLAGPLACMVSTTGCSMQRYTTHLLTLLGTEVPVVMPYGADLFLLPPLPFLFPFPVLFLSPFLLFPQYIPGGGTGAA